MVTAFVWGDGPAPELDRFQPVPASDPPYWGLNTNEYLAWWEAAREPWGCYIDLSTRGDEQDLQRTCDALGLNVVYSD